MTLTKSFLLGSAASMLAVSGASAADLPSKSKGPAVEYVRICDTYGAGYFYVPGTDTCLKISGYARADYAVRNVTNRFGTVGGSGTDAVPVKPTGISSAARNTTGFAGLGGLELDARSQTAWGTLRGFIRYEIFTNSGLFTNNTGITSASTANSGSGASLDKAFVQFAGVTAGRAQSFFTFYGDAYPLDISRGEDSTTHMLAYTASFGGGFSATVSIEDPVVRRGGIGTNSFEAPALNPLNNQIRSAIYGGSKIPDVVAQLRVDQSWGKAQLSGAYHEINTISDSKIGAPKASGTGWAVQAGIAINLPSLAAGDEVYLQGAYAVGAKSYLGLGSLGDRTNALQRNDVDAVAVASGIAAAKTYHLEKGKGYNIQGGIKHFWAPNLKSTLWAAYTTWGYGAQSRANTFDEGGFGNGKELMVGTQLIWTPVKNLDLTFDLSYQHLTQQVKQEVLGAKLPVGAKKDGSAFTGRLRIQRSF